MPSALAVLAADVGGWLALAVYFDGRPLLVLSAGGCRLAWA